MQKDNGDKAGGTNGTSLYGGDVGLWRTIKYEEDYLKAYDSVSVTKASLGNYLNFYNTRRPHQPLDGQTPDTIYFAGLPQQKLAA